ncbi:hypothetical protein IMZ48_05205 [Candidatus Bathyarchaeota archaeon]|nr:hypothetical protein [Candidatus Bathyarchaeota archaeon]
MAGDSGLGQADPFKRTYYTVGRPDGAQDRVGQKMSPIKTQEGETSAAETLPPYETFAEKFKRALLSGKDKVHKHQIDIALSKADPTSGKLFSDKDIEKEWKAMSNSIHCFITFQLSGRYVDSKSLAPEIQREVRRWGPNVGELLGDPRQAQFVFAARVWRTLYEQLFGADLKMRLDLSGALGQVFRDERFYERLGFSVGHIGGSSTAGFLGHVMGLCCPSFLVTDLVSGRRGTMDIMPVPDILSKPPYITPNQRWPEPLDDNH